MLLMVYLPTSPGLFNCRHVVHCPHLIDCVLYFLRELLPFLLSKYLPTR